MRRAGEKVVLMEYSDIRLGFRKFFSFSGRHVTDE